MSDCAICRQIELIRQGTHPGFVAELEAGYVIAGEYQYFRGYALFLCRRCIPELHLLDREFKIKFLEELTYVSEAVDDGFHPHKINYELLGNQVPHIHWHLFPRHKNDPAPLLPIWNIETSVRESQSAKPSPEEFLEIKRTLLKELRQSGATIRQAFE